jgi:hypothetical protein
MSKPISVVCVRDDFDNKATRRGRACVVKLGVVYKVIDSGIDHLGEWYELEIQPDVLYPKEAFDIYKPPTLSIFKRVKNFFKNLTIFAPTSNLKQ